MKKLLTFSWLLACLAFTSGCAVQLVSPYDEKSMTQMELIDQNIDRFYLVLQTQPEAERTYEKSASDYVDIDVNIRSLERRQAIREKNQDTLTQTQTLAALWKQDMAAHKTNNAVSDFIIKRRMDQYRRLMNALIEGELAKKP